MKCATCGNTYERSFRVIDRSGAEYHFDSIECAAHKLAPACAHCGCRVLGHGLESGGAVYCCGHCERQAQAGNAA
jgi:hypothetical protein